MGFRRVISLPVSSYGRTLWGVALVGMVMLAMYQRLTGPTHPRRGTVIVEGHSIRFRLPRSADTDEPARLTVAAPEDLTGQLRYRRHPSNDAWSAVAMAREGGVLVGRLPVQPAAGKVQYQVFIGEIPLTAVPLVLRYKDPVPAFILVPHVVLMFFAMVVAGRAGLEALDGAGRPRGYVVATLVCLVIGGFVLGPMVQKYAFGVYWTGWPFGTDLTDNKAAVALIAWLYAAIAGRGGRPARGAVVLALVVMVAVYLIPHSMWGSELDYRTGRAVNAAPFNGSRP